MRVCILNQDPAVYYRSYHYIHSEELSIFANRNTGTLADIYAVKYTTLNSAMFAPNTPAHIIKEHSDIILLPCTNILGLHADIDKINHLTQLIKDLDMPVVAVGLGAQSPSYDWDVDVAPEVVDFIKCIQDHRYSADAPNIFSRGPYSTHQLEKLGVCSSIPGCCPSFFISPLKQLGHVIRDSCYQKIPASIAVAGNHYSRLFNNDYEEQLLSLINDSITPGTYIPQSPMEMIALARGEFDAIDKETFDDINNSIAPHLTQSQFKQWCRQYMQPFFDIPVWIEYLRKFDMTIGARYTGVALALQAGRLGVNIATDSRTRESCEQTSIPFLWKDDIDFALTRKNLYDRFNDFNADRYDEIRLKQAITYGNFLKNNSIGISGSIYEFLHSYDIII